MVFYIGCVIIGVISALLGFHIYDSETGIINFFHLIIVVAVTLTLAFIYNNKE